ncbi:MAG: NADP oxidoreductase [Acidobacteria bacterium]|nr:NADP oxidoreductase [Acidobacteriota bacterium]
MSKIRLATAWLDGCSGCHMSLLDIDEAIAAVAQKVDLVYGPLVDAQEVPEGIDVAIVEGAVSSQDDLKLVQTMRKRSKLLVALGDCAVTSNVPAMRNPLPVKQILDRLYVKGATAQPGIPNEGVPPLLRHAVPVQEVVKVDLHVPGCPPPAPAILMVLSELVEGRKPDLAGKVKFG